MSFAEPLSESSHSPPQYARFVRRFRGIIIDWALSVFVIFGALIVSSATRSDEISRVVGVAVVIILVMYEPVMVSMTGGTIGHYLANLRVVDDARHGNVSFLKACARFVIKGVLGWYSFIVMAATRRNQALHDKLTRSTVQIRDAAKANPDHYILERAELSSPNMPSRTRRCVVIIAYLFLAFVLFVILFFSAVAVDALSEQCFYYDRCSKVENLVSIGIGLVWLAASACVVVFGWRGKLAGARLRKSAETETSSERRVG